MSEQTIQDGLYSIPVQLDKYICRSLGATTIKDLVKNKEVTGLTIKECDKIKANRPDVLILNKDKQIVVFIEMKEPDKLKTEKLQRLAKYQELGVARQVKAKIYMLSDGETFIWINPITGARITDENDKPITRKINPKNLSPEQNKELAEFIDDVCYCINDSNNKIMPKEYIDPTPLAQKVARILQNMSLSSAKNSLYTFVEFFTFKFLSDISVLRGIYSFEGIYSVYAEQSSKDAFIQYLTTVRKKLLELFPYNPEDGTTIINGRIFHTETDDIGNPVIHESSADCFGKLLDCFKEYEDEHGKFLYINKDFKSKLFETFMKNSTDKDGMGQFFTPLKVVQEMVRMVDVKEGMSICDPACGVGKFLLEAASKISSPFYFENGKLKAKIELVGMEKKMEDNTYDLTTILAKSNMLIYYSDLFKNNCDSIEKIQELSEQLLNKVITSSHTTLGTLENLYLDKYDLILANPPYYQSAAISEASKSVKIYGTETKAYTSGGRGIEALFTEWIVKSIKKGGIANIILPDGIFTNIGNNKLKQLIIENCYIDSIISLPVGTFFNTPKKTFILTIHKRTEEEMNKIQSYPVYTYLCSTIGETMDTYRFDIDENDLHDAVDLYNLYRGNKENKIAISAVNDNPRAKLIPVDKFGIEENWNIELFWSDEEKIELGIKKKDTIMSLEEFHGYISELIDDIKNYQEAIECLK